MIRTAFLRLLDKVVPWLLCPHDWVHAKTVEDQNLRSGHKHATEVWVCRDCKSIEHRELSK